LVGGEKQVPGCSLVLLRWAICGGRHRPMWCSCWWAWADCGRARLAAHHGGCGGSGGPELVKAHGWGGNRRRLVWARLNKKATAQRLFG
jgi:hypothetical protein